MVPQSAQIHRLVPRAPLRTAVIGAGYFGNFHAEKLASLPESKLVAVCDVDPVRAEALARKLGVEAVTDHRELFGRIDAASVVVPARDHFPVARDLLTAGIHVLVEKPISSTVAEADELIALAERGGLVLQVGHLERFNAALRALAESIDRPRFIECSRISPFGARGTDINVVLDMMIHDIDILLHLVKAPLIDVEAVGVPVLSDSEDIANARLRFADGCIAQVTASRISWKKGRTMRVFQPDSYLMLDYEQSTLSIARRVGGAGRAPKLQHEERAFQPTDYLLEEIDGFLGVILQRLRPVMPPAEARQALAAALRISADLERWRETNLRAATPTPR